MTNHKSKAQDLANKHWEMYGYGKYNPKTLAEMIEPALREAEETGRKQGDYYEGLQEGIKIGRLEGARKMRENCAKISEATPLTFHCTDSHHKQMIQNRGEIAKAIRSLSPESVLEG